MNPLRLCLASAGSLALGAIPITATNAPTPRPTRPPPNILLVVADDLGLQLGCYGDPVARTPEIDRFASASTRFATAYITQPSCSPSRSSLLTGLYPHQNGQIGLANRGYSMRPGIPTLPAMLRAGNYRTGIIGKLHVNPEADFPFDYEEKKPDEARDVRLVGGRAARFWRDCGERPWFLMVNYFDPHVPFITQHKGIPAKPQVASEMRAFSFQQTDTPAEREHIAGYYNGVSRVDTGFGLLLRELEATGQADRTLVIFMGDNGPPFVRAKTVGTEAGLRVPLIVRWPGAKSKGVVSHALASGIDLVPTVLELVGLPNRSALPGRSLLPLLEHGDAQGDEYIFAEHNAHRRDMYFPQRIVRDQRFKLVVNLKDRRDFGIEVDGDPAKSVLTDPEWSGSVAQRAFQQLVDPPEEELYDLQHDPDEFENLVSKPEHQATLLRLRAALTHWRKTTGDRLLDPQARAEELAAHDTARP